MTLKIHSSGYFVIVTISALLVASCHGKYIDVKNFGLYDDDDDDDDCLRRWDCDDDWKLSDGAIVGIVLAALFIFFGIPVILCFCCAWCCFKSRRKGKANPPVVVAAPMPQYQQSYPPQTTTSIIYQGTDENPPLNPHWQTQTNVPSAPYPVQQFGGYNSFSSTNTANEFNPLNAEPPPPYCWYNTTIASIKINSATASHTTAPQQSSRELGWNVN